MTQVTFRLYQVEYDDCGSSLNEILDDIYALPAENRLLDCGGNEGFLLELNRNTHMTTCIVSRLRMDDLPPATSRTGIRAALDLDEDQGLGEEMAFSYESILNVAAIQSNRFSFRHGKIAAYINSFAEGLNLRFVPIISPDIVRKFQSLTILRKLAFRISSTTNLDFLQQSGLSAAERNAIQEFLVAPYLEMTLSVGKTGRKTGLTRRVMELAHALKDAVWNGEDGIEKLVVSGKEEDGAATEEIDLLSDQIQYTAEVRRSRGDLGTNQLHVAAADAIRTNRQVLRQRHVS